MAAITLGFLRILVTAKILPSERNNRKHRAERNVHQLLNRGLGHHRVQCEADHAIFSGLGGYWALGPGVREGLAVSMNLSS